MLTFEEFFHKKKINLVQFQAAEPGLFQEFLSHYPLMGEKSFDHTKKYWFNGLRRIYPLTEAVKPHAVQVEAISQLAVQGVAVAAAQNVDVGIERPKFKEDNLPDLVDENVLKSEVSLTEEEKIIEEADPEIPTAKPAFKPRFSVKNMKKPEVAEENNLVEGGEEKSEAQEPVKPAFKPRFNTQNIKKEVVKEVFEIEKPEPATENTEPAIAASDENTEAKPAYKPRFQMKNIKPAQQKPDVVKPDEPAENPTSEAEPETPQPATESAENKEAKLVYKPRFQMKNMPKPAAGNLPPDAE